MYNSFTYKVTALLLAFLMFFSSIGYSMDIHYCKGEVWDIAFFGEVEVCEMQEEVTPVKECCHRVEVKERQCKNHSGDSGIQREDCCKNVELVLDVGDYNPTKEVDASIYKVLLFPISFIYALFVSGRNESVDEGESIYYYRSYFSTQELNLLHQVFII